MQSGGMVFNKKYLETLYIVAAAMSASEKVERPAFHWRDCIYNIINVDGLGFVNVQ